MPHKDAMNQLNVSLQHSIMTLAAHGWSHRRIARELDVNRETVGKYLRLAAAKPAISTPGSASDPAAKPAILTPGSAVDSDSKPAISISGSGRQSSCLPWQVPIEAAVAVGLSAQRIFQDLVGEHGFSRQLSGSQTVRAAACARPSRCRFVRMEVDCRCRKRRWILARARGCW